ncbi:MAG: zinc ribbon domain-containing protein [Caldilineaceae bacterium]|nr:zinc ribbon domain-containing protein [Caldilineaceae bacterium]
MLCPTCQRPNQDQAKFCLSCGASLTSGAPTVVKVSEQHCVQCSKELRPGAKFCGACGASQPKHVQTAIPPLRPAPPPLPPPLSPASPATGTLSRAYLLRHLLIGSVLAGGLLLALMAAFLYAPLATSVGAIAEAQPMMPTPVVPTPLPTATADYRQAVISLGASADGRFGLRTLQGDPANRSDDNKLLTFDAAGGTNDTRLWIDSATLPYGQGGLEQPPQTNNGQTTAVWLNDEIAVMQTLAYVYGTNTGRVDTIQIKYTLTNQGSVTKTVGLRLMLDTLIGNNDGVPFVVPGREGITDRAVDLRGAAIPDFVQALEKPDLADPGVIVHLTLQGADATRPDRLVISAWCETLGAWEYYGALGGDDHPLQRCGQAGNTPDSAISLYFDPQALGPGASRTLITYYGLGGISSTESRNPTLSLSFNRQVNQGDEFWITTLVGMPKAGQSVRLDLPDGLVLSNGMPAEQPVTPGGNFTQISWRVTAEKALNAATVTVQLSPDNLSESQSITVQSRGITR